MTHTGAPVRLLLVRSRLARLEAEVRAWSDEAGFEVTGASTAEEAADLLKTSHADVVVCGSVMWKRLRETAAQVFDKAPGPRPAIVLLTKKPYVETSPTLLGNIAAFVPQSINFQGLVTVVRAVAMGFRVTPNQALLAEADQFQNVWQRFTNKYGTKLSRRELDIVQLVAQGRSPEEIREILEISLRTVQGGVSRAITKLNLPSRLQLAVLVWAGTKQIFDSDPLIATSQDHNSARSDTEPGSVDGDSRVRREPV